MAPVVRSLLIAALAIASSFCPSPGVARAQGVTSIPSALPLWGSLQPGRFGAGFEVRVIESGTADVPRPLRILVWRPAVQGSGRSLAYGDYLGPPAARGLDQQAAAIYLAKDADSARRNLSGDRAADLLLTFMRIPVAARLDAVPARGAFPLVVHALGRNGYQLENILLWEYLASRGFVVAVVPQIAEGIYSRGLRFDRHDLQLQADDIVRTVDFMRGLRGVDKRRLLYTGHSMGAPSALIAAQSRPAQALVSLDGAQAATEGHALLPQDFVGALRAVPRILHLHNADNRVRVAGWHLNYPGRIHEVGFRKSTHFDFQMWPLFAEQSGVDDPRGVEARPTARGAEVLRASVAIAGCYLEAVTFHRDVEMCFRNLPPETEVKSHLRGSSRPLSTDRGHSANFPPPVHFLQRPARRSELAA